MADLNDMSLLDLFLMETGAQSLTLAHELARWDGEHGGSLPDFTTMHRAVHSITGAARIVDLQQVIELTQAMEHGLRIASARSTPEARQLIETATDHLSRLAKTNAGQIQDALKERKNLFANLVQHLKALSSASSPPADKPGTAEEALPPHSLAGQGMFQIFTEDAENHLAVLSDNLIQIEKTPDSAVLLESSMRAVHSLKGAARVIGLTDIVTLTHIMEELFIAAQTRGLILTADHIDTLFAAADLIRELTKEEENTLPQWFERNKAALTSLTGQLNLIAGKQEHPPAPPEPPAASAPLVEPMAERGESAPPKTVADRHLRVSAQGMSRVLALASEAMVESRWLPSLSTNLTRLKRLQDEAWYALEKLRLQLPETGAMAVITNNLAEITAKLKRNQDFLGRQLGELTEHSTHSVNIAHRLHNEVISNRMQPLAEGLVGLPRLVRDLSRKLDKSVRLDISGADTLIDRDILEKLESPLTHLITNAVDHGVEAPEVRREAGKPQEATIRLNAKHHAGMMVITISDDGCGLDFDTLRQKAVEKRLVSEKVAADLNETELSHFLFLPNFTTKTVADSTSGRGVGLDIVHNAIREIRGNIELHSVAGHGLTFELHLPLTLSIIRGLLLQINNEPYALPLVNIDHAVRLPLSEVKEMGNRPYFISNNRRVGLITAQQTLELKEQHREEEILSIIVISSGANSYGLIVDRFDGIRDLVVHPLNPRLGKLRSISAAAIAEDGTPILILDINDLRQAMDHLISGDRLQRIAPQVARDQARSNRKRILVVDDSITVREVERKILTDHGFEVDVAVDGLDAWSMVRHNRYDLIITDIDMPNLDGIELLVHIKNTAEYESIPVIILSYKDREEDKSRGLEAGADYYLTKSSFHDQALIEAVEDLIGEAGGVS